MAEKILRIFAVAAALGTFLCLGVPEQVWARGGGGGHSGGGGGHFGGGGGHFGGFGGGHGFGGARMAGFSGAHLGRSAHIAHMGSGHSRFSGSHIGTSHLAHMNNSHLAHMNNMRAHTLGAGALAGRTAWNHWGNPNWHGGWHGGWRGWAGPVFWPYFFGNLFAFSFWPYPFFDPFWAYGDWFVWDALFWPGPSYAYGPAFAYGPDYYDVYGGYAYDRPRRSRVARHADPETTGSTPDKTELAESCGGLAPGVTDLPIDRIDKAIQPNDEQRKGLDALKSASSQASDVLKASCSNEVPLTPVARLDAVQKRIDSLMQAFGSVRTPLDNFYNSLNDEQKQRFAALGQASNARMSRRETSSNGLAALCSRHSENFTQLPAERVEQTIKPTKEQLDAFAKLKIASTEAANQLHATCPEQLPQTPLDRFDAVGKRLEAMDQAIKTVRPALADFYAALTDEQKARFNTLGPPQNGPASEVRRRTAQ